MKPLQQRNNKGKVIRGQNRKILSLPGNLPIKVCLESVNNNAWTTPCVSPPNMIFI